MGGEGRGELGVRIAKQLPETKEISPAGRPGRVIGESRRPLLYADRRDVS